MPSWKRTLDGVAAVILTYGYEEGEEKDPAVIAKKLHERLKGESCFAGLEQEEFIRIDDLLYMERVAELDDWLQSFYDFCDDHRIWIGQ